MKAIVTVIGKDRVGIIALVSQLLAERGVNVLDISQTVLQDYFTMIMLVDASACTEPFANLAGELAADALGPVPLDGVELESVRLENGAAVLTLRGERGAAWLSSVPLAQLGIHGQPWRGSARPGALYTEYLGGGWYAGYACLGWR